MQPAAHVSGSLPHHGAVLLVLGEAGDTVLSPAKLLTQLPVILDNCRRRYIYLQTHRTHSSHDKAWNIAKAPQEGIYDSRQSRGHETLWFRRSSLWKPSGGSSWRLKTVVITRCSTVRSPKQRSRKERSKIFLIDFCLATDTRCCHSDLRPRDMSPIMLLSDILLSVWSLCGVLRKGKGRVPPLKMPLVSA